MEKKFSPIILASIVHKLRERTDEISYIGDLSDLGNELGVIVGNHFENMNENDISDFIRGFKHGISLTNKVHP